MDGGPADEDGKQGILAVSLRSFEEKKHYLWDKSLCPPSAPLCERRGSEPEPKPANEPKDPKSLQAKLFLFLTMPSRPYLDALLRKALR